MTCFLNIDAERAAFSARTFTRFCPTPVVLQDEVLDPAPSAIWLLDAA